MIETERLIIRPFKDEDYKRVYEVCNDYELAKTTLGIPIPYTEENAKTFIEKTKKRLEDNISYELAVCFKENPNKVVGCVSLVGINPVARKAEMGYWVARELWGKGIATEAARAIIKFGFEKLNLHSIMARYFNENTASGKVMQKCGMKYVGIMRDNEFRLDEFHDVVYYELIETDLKL